MGIAVLGDFRRCRGYRAAGQIYINRLRRQMHKKSRAVATGCNSTYRAECSKAAEPFARRHPR